MITEDGAIEPVFVAEITGAGFSVARVPPLLGRPVVDEDERKGAPPVIVIGYDVWRSRFASDPSTVGRTIRLGNTVHTVVGVMPEGFGFPVNHRVWVPLQANPSDYERREGPAIEVFGRLGPGATLESAQAELTTIGLRVAAAFPKTNEQLRPRIVPYASLWFNELEIWMVHIMQFLVTMLLVAVCVNVAILVYARTATRQGEIAVRTALGASRRRIVGQLFVEALVLSVVAATVGLVLAQLGIENVNAFLEQQAGRAPFWVDYSLSADRVLYVLGLTILGAAIVGVVPALKATGGRLEPGLRQLGGATGLQLGRTWTVLIVAQVAFTVAVMPAAMSMGWNSIRYGTFEPGFAAAEFLTARIGMDREVPSSAEAERNSREFASRSGDRLAELVRRLEAEPGVTDVTFASRVPGQEPTVWIDIEGMALPTEKGDYSIESGSSLGHGVRLGRVDVGFFHAFNARILAGRQFRAADLHAAANAIIVNQAFVQQLLGGSSPLGRRIRYVGTSGDALPGEAELGRWYEIVGVVSDVPAHGIHPGLADGKLYHPAATGQIQTATLAVRVRGTTPATFAARLREIATALDPTLRLNGILPLDEVYRQEQMGMHMVALAVGLVTLSVLFLSSAGIYAMMSFTVAQRRREIGIRSALGADPRRILGGIFSRALAQVAIGVVVGLAVATSLDVLTEGEVMGGEGAVFLPAVSALMMTVGLLAALGPARRGLRIHPTEALREQ